MTILSACLLLKNEEKYLYRCLSSIQTIVDEIIVVDTGSTDNSVQQASEFGAQVFFTEWTNDFSLARNFSLEQASGEWILVIDADEELDGKCLRSLKKRIQTPDADAYLLNVTPSWLKNQQKFFEPSSLQLRLFRNNRNYRYEGFIHEQVLDSILESNPSVTIKTAPEITIIHQGNNPENTREEYRLKRNVNLINLVLSKESENTAKHFLLGREYCRHYKYLQALTHLRLAYQNQDKQAKYIPELLRLIISCLYQLDKESEALTFLDQALINWPGSADLYYIKGMIFLTLGLYPQANHSLEAALSCYPCPPYRNLIFYYAKHDCRFLLGALAEYFMDMDSALVYYLESLKDNPYLIAPLHRMIAILNPRQNPEYTVNSLNQVFDLSDPGLKVDLAAIFYDEGAYRLAFDCLNKLETSRQMTERAMLLKGLCLLRLKKYTEAEEALHNIIHDPRLFIESRQYLLLLQVINNCPLALEYLEQIKNSGADATTLYVLNLLTHSPANDDGIVRNQAYALAKRFIELTVEIGDKNQIARIFNSLGSLLEKRPSRLLAETLYNFEKYELAKKEYISLLKTGQDSPLIFYYLGKTCWALEDLESALQYINQAMSGGLDTPKIRREKERLDQELTLNLLKNKLLYFPDQQELIQKIKAIEGAMIEI